MKLVRLFFIGVLGASLAALLYVAPAPASAAHAAPAPGAARR